jgi:hypothetical protein
MRDIREEKIDLHFLEIVLQTPPSRFFRKKLLETISKNHLKNTMNLNRALATRNAFSTFHHPSIGP